MPSEKRKQGRARFRAICELPERIKTMPLGKAIASYELEDLTFWVGPGGEMGLRHADFKELRALAEENPEFRKSLSNSSCPLLKHLGKYATLYPHKPWTKEKREEILEVIGLFKVDITGGLFNPTDLMGIHKRLIASNLNNLQIILDSIHPKVLEVEIYKNLFNLSIRHHKHIKTEIDFENEIASRILNNEETLKYINSESKIPNFGEKFKSRTMLYALEKALIEALESRKKGIKTPIHNFIFSMQNNATCKKLSPYFQQFIQNTDRELFKRLEPSEHAILRAGLNHPHIHEILIGDISDLPKTTQEAAKKFKILLVETEKFKQTLNESFKQPEHK
jgi:hypothetical protein